MKNDSNFQLSIEAVLDKALLYCDSENRYSLECLVFANYNEMYQNIKYSKNIYQNNIDLINLLHFVQYQTINLKFHNIQ